MSKNKLAISTPTDCELRFTREFAAPQQMVFDAHTKPELVRRWLSGPPGWSMSVCEIDLRVGGAYRYAWQHSAGHQMGMGGAYREITAPARIVCTEKFDDPWYPGEATGTLELVERDGITTLTNTIRYGSKEIRDAVLKSPMEQGVSAGYDNMEALLSEATKPSA